MVMKRWLWIFILFLALITTATVCLPVYAVTSEDIDEKQEELDEIEKRQREERSNLEQRLNREAALEEEVKQLEAHLDELREEQKKLEAEIGVVEQEISVAEEELAEAEEDLREQEDLLNLRLKAIQQYGVVAYVEVLFDSASFSDFLTRLYNLSIIASNDLRLIEEIQEERNVIQTWKDELEEKKAGLENMHQQVAANEKEMERAAADREIILGELQDEITKTLGAIANLEEEAQRIESNIQDMIAELESQFSGVEGDLYWPVESPTSITSGYGWRRDPFSGNQAWHGGVDIAPHHGEANYILAAERGEVIYSGWNGGYGNCIMIDHGGGTVTLYAHMSTLSVKKGDIVEKGQRIARAGTTGYSTGVHLHFEVREFKKTPVRSFPSGNPDHRFNPMDYF